MNLFNYIKSKITILNIINEYTTLKQAGIYWKGICPFHNEKTPSFTVSPHRDIFYCFGCHSSGDAISFIAKIENCSQIQAAKFLVERYAIDLPSEFDRDLKVPLESKDEKEKYFQICKITSEWCSENLKTHKYSMNYLKSRGFTLDTITKYSIGYFPGGMTSIKSFLKIMNKNGVLAQDLTKSYILMEGKNTFYSPFEERIIFPIKDSLGRFCGFGGRIFKENDERAKYYNSHESNYFNKGSLLFGLDIAKKQIQEKGFTFLVEGYTDCLAMAQYGYQNTVAVLGTACTIEHLKQLSRFTQQIYVLYDADLAGQKAILRLTEMCWNVNLELRVICLENQEDPASFLTKNGNLKNLVLTAKDIYSFFIENYSKDFFSKTLQEKINTVKKITSIIHNIADPIKRDILLQDVANKLNIPLDSIRNNKDAKEDYSKQTILKHDMIKNNNKELQITTLEKRLFSTIISNFDLFSSYYYLSDFFTSPFKEILNTFIELKKNNNNISSNDLYNTLDEDQKNIINKILLEVEQDTSNNFSELILQFQKKNWKKITILIKQKLINAQENSDHESRDKIISDFEKLKNKFINGGCQ